MSIKKKRTPDEILDEKILREVRNELRGLFSDSSKKSKENTELKLKPKKHRT